MKPTRGLRVRSSASSGGGGRTVPVASFGPALGASLGTV